MYTIITKQNKVINDLTYEQAIAICPEDGILLTVNDGRITAIRKVERTDVYGDIEISVTHLDTIV